MEKLREVVRSSNSRMGRNYENVNRDSCAARRGRIGVEGGRLTFMIAVASNMDMRSMDIAEARSTCWFAHKV